MEELRNLIAAYSQQAVVSLLMWSWQALLLLGLVWLLKRCLQSLPPAIHYQIWLYGLLAIALLPICVEMFNQIPRLPSSIEPLNPIIRLPEQLAPRLSPIPPFAQVENEMPSAPLSMPVPAVAPVEYSQIWTLMFVVWIIGASLNLLRLSISYSKLQKVRERAHPISLDELGCAELVGGHLPKRLCIGLSTEVQAPLLTGILRPMILLPSDIRSWTTVEERASILQHELAHIERLDHLVNPLQAMLTLIFFFHPMVHFACRQLNLERELACDERVLRMGVVPAIYAESILKVVERNVVPDMVHQPASFASRKTLERRLAMILYNNRLPVLVRHWPFLILPALFLTVMVWLLTGHNTAAGSWSRQAEPNHQAVWDNAPSLSGSSESTVDASSLPQKDAGNSAPANHYAEAPAVQSSNPAATRNDGAARLVAPKLIDPGFETFSPARGPIFGWYSDELLYTNDQRFGQVTMTRDSTTRVEGLYSLHIDQLEPRPQGRGQVFISQSVQLPSGQKPTRRFELAAQMQGRMEGQVTIEIYVWDANHFAQVIARQVVTVSRSWAQTTLTFKVPRGRDEFGIWFYLPREPEAQLWLDDIQLRPLAD